MIRVSSQFDAGNIETVAVDNPADIQLKIRLDNESAFFQWFYFRLQGAQNEPLKIRLLNANEAAYVDGWPDYRAVASYDRKSWFRVPTDYIDGELVIQHTPEQQSVYYAYFAPYSYERHLDLIARCALSPLVVEHDLGATLDGRDITLLQVGDGAPEKANIWVTARQHPGETMAQWCAEGLLERLLDGNDALSKALLEHATFWVVPNMNPDGAVRGHLRTNACGANLNREWQTPTLERSPEVYYVRQKMQQVGVSLFLDLHGDEALPVNFIAGQEGAPVDDAILRQETQFRLDLMRANPDFQMERGYEVGKFGPEMMTIASFWVGGHFRCPAMTLEMPFKDYDLKPDPVYGWSPQRSITLGASILHPIYEWLQCA